MQQRNKVIPLHLLPDADFRAMFEGTGIAERLTRESAGLGVVSCGSVGSDAGRGIAGPHGRARNPRVNGTGRGSVKPMGK